MHGIPYAYLDPPVPVHVLELDWPLSLISSWPSFLLASEVSSYLLHVNKFNLSQNCYQHSTVT